MYVRIYLAVKTIRYTYNNALLREENNSLARKKIHDQRKATNVKHTHRLRNNEEPKNEPKQTRQTKKTLNYQKHRKVQSILSFKNILIY